jgi:hypothetical protein
MLIFVFCASCGAVVGVTDYRNVGLALAEIEDLVRSIRDRIR